MQTMSESFPHIYQQVKYAAYFTTFFQSKNIHLGVVHKLCRLGKEEGRGVAPKTINYIDLT